jgi:2-dehydropantoate 2-reductase
MLTLSAAAEAAAPAAVAALRRAGFKVSTLRSRADFEAVQRGKLLVNLFNAPNALSGRPSSHALLDRGCCALTLACVREARACFRAAGCTTQPALPIELLAALLAALAHPLGHAAALTALTLLAALAAAVRALRSALWRSPQGPASGQASVLKTSEQSGQPPWWSPYAVLDSTAHSSMWEDLQNLKESEVRSDHAPKLNTPVALFSVFFFR